MRMDVLSAGVVNDWTKIGDLGSMAQLYPSCAQLNIVSESKGTLPRGVSIPEIFALDAPGLYSALTLLWRILTLI
jgi:hypothetical protein